MIDSPAGASRECNFHKLFCINNLILSVLGDVHSIEKTLFSVTSKVDSAITVISGASTEAETASDDLMIRDLIIHSKDRLVLSQILSKEPCSPQNTDQEYTSKVSPLLDFQKCVLLSNQAQTHAASERKISHHELFNESPIDLARREEDNILCEELKSPRIDGQCPFGEDDDDMKEEPVEVDERDKKAEKISIEVMDEQISWTHSCITVG